MSNSFVYNYNKHIRGLTIAFNIGTYNTYNEERERKINIEIPNIKETVKSIMVIKNIIIMTDEGDIGEIDPKRIIFWKINNI